MLKSQIMRENQVEIDELKETQAIEMEECKQQFQEQIDKLKSRLNAESQLKESYYIEL